MGQQHLLIGAALLHVRYKEGIAPKGNAITEYIFVEFCLESSLFIP